MQVLEPADRLARKTHPRAQFFCAQACGLPCAPESVQQATCRIRRDRAADDGGFFAATEHAARLRRQIAASCGMLVRSP
jgi:hypothetical protein